MIQTASELETLVEKAWSPEQLSELGDKQAKLLEELVGRQESWTVDELENLLLMVKHEFPEELVDLSRSWDQPKKDINP